MRSPNQSQFIKELTLLFSYNQLYKLAIVTILLNVSTLLTAPVLANEPDFFARLHIGTNSGYTRSVAVGDMNGDGHLDVVVGDYHNPLKNTVYLNDGEGNFTANNFIDTDSSQGNTWSIAVGDMNGDGHLDIVAGNGTRPYNSKQNKQNLVYLNDGAGNFEKTRNFGTGDDDTRSVAVGDVDGKDGLDIIVGNFIDDETEENSGQNVVYLNDGTGNFTENNTSPFGTGDDNTSSIAIGDMDGKDGLDIVVGNQNKQNMVYLNNGAGRFENTSPFGTGDGDTRSVVVGDIDGKDGLDIIVGNINKQDMVYLNDGAGRFENTSPFGITDRTSSIAVGDMNGDGHLDIVAGRADGQNKVFLNNGSGGFSEPDHIRDFGTGEDRTYGVVAGDMDSDGDLDIVVGNETTPDAVYFNDGAGKYSDAESDTRKFGIDPSIDRYTSNVAIGDMDGKDGLDIVVGYSKLRHCWTDGYWDDELNEDRRGRSAVYLNDGAGNFFESSESGLPIDFIDDRAISSVAVGDMDGKDGLDIIVGNYAGYNMVYLNNGTGSFTGPNRFGTGVDQTTSIAVADMDNDGHLDILVGNDSQQSLIYLNDGVGNFFEGDIDETTEDHIRPFGADTHPTTTIVVGDMDGRNGLDIVVGNYFQPSMIYFNDGVGNFFEENSRLFGNSEPIQSVAVGDMDNNGYLDILAGSVTAQNMVHLNDGMGNFPNSSARPFGTGGDVTFSVAVGDMDGDGHLDIISGDCGGQSAVYLNDGAGFFSWHENARDFRSKSATRSLAVGDMDGDNHLDIVVGNYYSGLAPQNEVVYSRIRPRTGLSNHPPQISVESIAGAVDSRLYATPVIQTQRSITLTYTLSDTEGENVGQVKVFYSVDGGGNWELAVASPDTITTNLATRSPVSSTMPASHTYVWDVWASEFFGQSDNVVVRMVAYSQPPPANDSLSGTYHYTNTTPAPILWPYSASTTFPFRVRGTQVQVTTESDSVESVVDAIVYQLPSGQARDAQPMGGVDLPFRTNSDGYLDGRGRIAISDTLIALLPAALPITLSKQLSDTARLYYTSDIPGIHGAAPITVSKPGVQQVSVSENNPLLLFDLDVALEWDARQDAQFVAQLEFDLKRASELLFDWSNGQIALGNTTIYHDARSVPEENGFQPWEDAHIRIYATNRLRPNAVPGGIVRSTLTDTVKLSSTGTITFTRGQIRMPVIWNRYGESSGRLGEDWPRALAHELGHYLLFLDDNYIGLNERGLLVAVPEANCPGVMNSPYSNVNSEFHPESGWLTSCTETLSHQRMGRSDWETIHSIYDMLDKPDGGINDEDIAGPSGLPLSLTQVKHLPEQEGESLDVPIFFLSQNGQAIQTGNSARAFFYPKSGDRLIDLGRPSRDQVHAYGAQLGDKLCVYELAASRLGCQEIESGNDQLLLHHVENWQPEVLVTPITSTTLHISVQSAIDGPLKAMLYPVNNLAPIEIPLQQNPEKVNDKYVYMGTSLKLKEPVLEGYVRVWIDGIANPTPETVIDYALGGNPIHLWSRNIHLWSRNIHLWSRNVPAISADGQVTLFGDQLQRKQDEEWIFTVQGASTTPDSPPWLNVVGQAYWIIATENAPDLNGASLSFQYLGEDVPVGEENFLQIYYRAENDSKVCPTSQAFSCWQPLHTEQDSVYNIASASIQGPGLYALMSSVPVKVESAGWNFIGYPLQESQPVTQALASAEGIYQAIYGYDPSRDNPWLIHDVNVEPSLSPLVNNLKSLEFAKGYWLLVTEPITIYMTSPSLRSEVQAAAIDGQSTPLIPAIYYGWVGEASAGTALFHVPITAEIDGVNCGQASIQLIDGKAAYILYVKAADPADATLTCGEPGKDVAFKINSQVVATAPWNNGSPQYFNLADVPIDTPRPDIETNIELYFPVIVH
ncbi:MAG: VCBS repeat-containing protein [Chloroflexota bacterium]